MSGVCVWGDECVCVCVCEWYVYSIHMCLCEFWPLYLIRVSRFFFKPLLSDAMPLGKFKLSDGDVNPLCLFLRK